MVALIVLLLILAIFGGLGFGRAPTPGTPGHSIFIDPPSAWVR
jgi:hypothetical protein